MTMKETAPTLLAPLCAARGHARSLPHEPVWAVRPPRRGMSPPGDDWGLEARFREPSPRRGTSPPGDDWLQGGPAGPQELSSIRSEGACPSGTRVKRVRSSPQSSTRRGPAPPRCLLGQTSGARTRRTQSASAAWLCSALAALLAFTAPVADAEGLVLAAEGRSDYQIVLPDAAPSLSVGECLNQVARLVQTAFKANGADVPVVAEGKRDAAKPGIYLSSTAFARAKGVEFAKLKGWGYVHKVVGRDVILAGRDHSSPDQGGTKNSRRPTWDRVATAKAVADFLREYAGTRFLYPDLGPRQSIKGAAAIDFLKSPAFEFLPTPTIAVPEDLNVQRTPVLEFNTAYPPRGSFYDLANNRFPLVDSVFGGHTYARAVPPDKYRETHPEYFALVGGRRQVEGHGQYCISNPEFQELVYQDLIGWIDRGYETVDLGQPDGFRACQCENCDKLYDTGPDWSEKLWIFNRKLAERVLAARPGRKVSMISYILTAAPPKTFKTFPANTRVMWCSTSESEIARWSEHKVPGGFTAYLYNWCPNLGTRYTPMRTPRFIETQAKRLFRDKVRAINRDGPGALYGLEGPVYYIMGRMFDDPETSQAKFLMHEFCGAAFGKAGARMLRFYDELYHALEPYSDYLGTHCSGWTYQNIYGQGRKLLSDPFRLLGFLYTPNLLESLEKQLAQAEKAADTDKVRARLAVVRREFDYVKHLARVVHLYHGYQTQPDLASRNRLLDAIDARNVYVDSLYDRKAWPKPMSAWSFVTFPPVGHTPPHLRLAYNGYQEPFADTVLNWDTKLMREAPLPGAKRFVVGQAEGPVTMDSPQWDRAAANELRDLPAESEGSKPRTKIALPVPGELIDESDDEPAPVDAPRKTALKLLFDETSLYLRVESELPAVLMRGRGVARDGDLTKQESLDLYLEPSPGSEICYRFMVGPQAESKYDAASGFITDAMDPRHGKFDPDWNGDWKYETRLEPKEDRWLALITIPYKTLGVETPTAGTFWRGNVGRNHVPGPGLVRRSVLAVDPQTKSVADKNSFAELAFHVPGSEAEAKPAKNPLEEWREKYYGTSFRIPEAWKKLPDPLPAPLDTWLFRTDPLEVGLKEGWHGAKVNEADWLPMRVPSFWAEVEEIGDYQGYGWYRTTFNVPAEWKGRTVRLLFASVDEQAWVYVNGQLVREHTEKSERRSFVELWETPFAAEVKPEQLEYGKPNVLAVRVHNSKANGGLWRPVLGHAVGDRP